MTVPSMSRGDWEHVKRIASEAWAQPAAERTRYALQACAGDEALGAEVVSLLESMEEVGDRFETPALALPSSRRALADALQAPILIDPGGRIGSWNVLRQLGSGGMGTVYLAERVVEEFRQRAAIKIVRGGAADDILLRRFQDERRILAALDHPHIARLIDGGASELGLPYVVMEYVDGRPIDTFCNEQALDVRQRLEIFRLVCLAVHYAHQHLVVHRDLKASNILVTADGTPKLLDFGIAKILERDSPVDTTRTLFRILTPESASPEQLLGGPITTAADIYSLGVLLYRLLSGRSPYRAAATASETELIRAVCEQTPVAPSLGARESVGAAAHHAIAPDLDRIVLMALRKEPERRYASAEQFAEDVRRYLEGRPVLAAPDRSLYRARKFVARNRVAVAAAAGFLLAVAGGVGTVTWQARVARLERNRAQHQFNAVKSLATSVLGELHDAVVGLPGSLAARELLIRRATEYLEALSPDAQHDVALRRELAFGYKRLGQVQGQSGVPNLGDSATARRSLEHAAALFESLPEPLGVDAGVGLADTYIALYRSDRDRTPDNVFRQRAESWLKRFLAEAPSNPGVQATDASLWSALGNDQEAGKDYEGALVSFLRMTRAAEAWLALAPTSLDASRTLSLAYKKAGTEHEMLRRPDEAIGFYEKAVALDRSRVDREPSRGLWRLDLSFSYGAMGSALARQGQTERALEQYRQAVELRRSVVAADPDDDFAKTALARGYERVAWLLGRSGDIDNALAAEEARIAALAERRAAHPDREAVWNDEASTTFSAARRSLDLLESRRASVRPAQVQRVRAMLDRVAALQTQWSRGTRTALLPPPSPQLREAFDRSDRLMASPSR
jgi:eukaryotic-like serine/threonine-protein kinase